MQLAHYSEIALALTMLIGPVIIVWKRTGAKDTKGVGVRVIQLVSLFLLVPLVGILALEGKLSGDSSSALIGVMLGFTLKGVRKPVPSNKKKKQSPYPAGG